VTWQKRQRRRLLWAGVLLGLVLVVATTSLIRAGLWLRRSRETALFPDHRGPAATG